MRSPQVLRGAGGAAAAEMALVLPLMITMLLVCFEGGYFLWNEHKVVKGVRDGARYAGRLSFTQYPCGGAVVSAAETNIKNLTRTGKLSGGTPLIYGWTNAHVTVSFTCKTGAGMYELNSNNAPVVTVSAIVPYPSSPLTDVAKSLGFGGSLSLRAEAQSPVMGL